MSAELSDFTHPPDSSLLDELSAAEERLRVLDARLERLEELKADVSAAVFRRVVEDYAGQRASLVERVRPLRERVRTALAETATTRDTLREALAATRSEEEELRLRCAVGELDEERIGERLAELAAQGGRLDTELAAAEEASDRLAAALGTEAALPAAEAPSPPAAEPAETVEPTPPPAWDTAEYTVDPPAVDDGPARAETTGPAPGAAPDAADPSAPPSTGAAASSPLDGTLYLDLERRGTGAPEGTFPLSGARLVPEDPLPHGRTELPVGPHARIGRIASSDVQLDDVSVSRRHAEISLGEAGYTLRDLGSQNGTFVNGDRIDERLLADGDRVLIGTVALRFHLPDAGAAEESA